jgi:hypothetical protein
MEPEMSFNDLEHSIKASELRIKEKRIPANAGDVLYEP